MALISGGALLLRLPGLNRSLEFDELYTAFHFIETEGFWETVSTYHVFNNHIAYSVLGRISYLLFGHSDWAVRVPALVIGLGGVLFTWYFVRQLFNPQLAVLSALILAISPAHVLWSKSARAYSALVLLPLLSSYFFLRLLQRPTRRYLFLYIIFSTIGIYFHLYVVWIIVVQGLYLLYLLLREMLAGFNGRSLGRASYRALWFAFPTVGALSLMLYAPVMSQLLENISLRGQSPAFNPAFPLDVVMEFGGRNSLWAAWLILGLVVVGGLALAKAAPQVVTYFLLTLAVPLLVMWLILRPFDLYPRFFAYLLPFYVLFLAAGLIQVWNGIKKIRPAFIRFAGTLLLAGLLGTVVFFWLVDIFTVSVSTDYRAAMQYLVEDAPHGTIMCAFGYDAEIAAYYQDVELVYPQAIENLDLVQPGTPINCLYHDVFWNTPQHKELAAFLAERAEMKDFGDLTIFKFVR
ncbi:MAG: hypothetical protein Kow0031_07970 [Anaerolineae bacterium]